MYLKIQFLVYNDEIYMFYFISYLKAGGVSNMAIAEVKMPTGWEPVVDSLDLVRSKLCVRHSQPTISQSQKQSNLLLFKK